MVDIDLTEDPYITWALAWVADREAPGRRCRRRRLILRALAVAAVIASNLFQLHLLGVI